MKLPDLPTWITSSPDTMPPTLRTEIEDELMTYGHKCYLEALHAVNLIAITWAYDMAPLDPHGALGAQRVQYDIEALIRSES